MAMKQRGRSKSETPQAASSNVDDVKFLVSAHCGLCYKSQTSNRTIVFDQEIAPRIFTPSAPVPKDLAEEYRGNRGKFGVMVYGSEERQMTRAEIDGLQPDDPETVDREMRGIVTQKLGSAFYDVIRVPSRRIKPCKLSNDARGQLARALGRPPSAKFIAEAKRALAFYLWDKEQISKVTPKKVQTRIGNVRKQIEALCDAIKELEMSDSNLIGLAAERERRKGRRIITGLQLRGMLTLYHRHVAEAEGRVRRNSSERGRMREYAKDTFAKAILAALENETGKRATTTRARMSAGMTSKGSVFSQVLKILLNSVHPGLFKPRKDVEALARRAVRSPDFDTG